MLAHLSSEQRRERHMLESERWRSEHWKQHQNPWSGCKASKSSPTLTSHWKRKCPPLSFKPRFMFLLGILGSDMLDLTPHFYPSLLTPHSIRSSVHKTFWLSCSQLRTRSCRLFASYVWHSHVCVIVLSPCLLLTLLHLFLLIAMHTTQLWDFSFAHASPQRKVLLQGC